MRDRVWKKLNNYCLLELNTTGVSHKDRILEVCCLKVIDNSIVDKFHTKVNPNYKDLERQVKYKEYYSYPTVKEIVPKILEFVKGFYLVGWCIDFHLDHLEREGKFEYNKNCVDVFESYYRTHKNYVCPCSLENIYNYVFKKKADYKYYDFDNSEDRCLAIKQVYEQKIRSNMFIYKELPQADYLEFADGGKFWLNHKNNNKTK